MKPCHQNLLRPLSFLNVREDRELMSIVTRQDKQTETKINIHYELIGRGDEVMR